MRHDLSIGSWLRDAAHDLRFALRLFVKERRTTAVALGALALGLAAATVVFTIVNAMTLRGLPVERPDRVVAFADGDRPLLVSYRDVEDWRAASATLAGVAVFSDTSMIVGDETQSPEVFPGAYLSANAFALLGERPILGRDFRADDDRPGAPAVAIVGHSVWANRFGLDPRVIGRTIRVNNVPSVIVGVMPAGFRFPMVHDVWQPLALAPKLERERRDARMLRAFGRLADGVTLAAANAELAAVGARLARQFPDTNRDVRPAVARYTGTASQPIFLALFGAVGFVLLIACANVANLLLARAAARAREMSIRASLGASRWRLFRQLLVESTLLAIAAGVVGLALALAGVRLFALTVEGINFAYWYRDRWTIDGRVFAFMAAACAATVVLSGLVPALQLSRGSAGAALREAARGVAGGAARRWTDVLLAAQLAFTLVLLAGAGLMMRSFLAVYRADAIVDAPRVLTMSIRMPSAPYASPDRRRALLERLEDRLAALPPIASFALANAVPFIGGATRQVLVDDRAQGPEPPPTASQVWIGDGYFEVLGLPLLRGRAFTRLDGTAGHDGAIVNARFAARFFPGQDPIGRRIGLADPGARNDPPRSHIVVGVAPDVRQQFFRDLDAVVYVPYRANPGLGPMLMLRGHTDPAALTASVREVVRDLDPDLALFRIVPLERLMTQSRWGHRVFGVMFALFAIVALVLSAIGVYAITAHAIAQRTQEIGVRMALGAQPRAVVWMFVRRTVLPLGAGAALGLGGAAAAGALMRDFLVQTRPVEPAALIAIALLLAGTAVGACVWPARRAAGLDPMQALRAE